MQVFRKKLEETLEIRQQPDWKQFYQQGDLHRVQLKRVNVQSDLTLKERKLNKLKLNQPCISKTRTAGGRLMKLMSRQKQRKIKFHKNNNYQDHQSVLIISTKKSTGCRNTLRMGNLIIA